MKPTVKIASLLTAVLMLFTVFASGCSLDKEWSYKTDDNELAIGVYLTAMREAYEEAKTYAAKLDGYDASSEKWLDMEITDDDGNKQVAKDWIKDTAERKCLELLVLQPELDKLGATVDEATLKTSKESLETQWYSGGKTALEGHGVSMESFVYFESTYSVLRDQLFDLLYGEGGSQEVSKDEITKYLTEKYGRFGAVPVPLYESTTDEAGQSTTATLDEKQTKEITDKIDGIVKKVNAEKDAKKAVESATKLITEYLKANGKEDSQVTNVTLERENTGITEEALSKALANLEIGKAVAVKTGEGSNQSYFFLFRYDNDSLKENYQNDGVTDKTILKKMKSKDYTAYLKDLIDKSNYKKSDSVATYEPKMFFEKQETTTSASVN